METTEVKVCVPKILFSYGLREEEVGRELNKWLVFTLFRRGHISSGKAASLLGMSRRDLLELLDEEGIAYFNYSQEDIEAEFKAAQSL